MTLTLAAVALPALLPDWLDPETLLERLGPWAFWGAVAIVFAECGLLIGFFLPGDSLLFVVGLFIASGFINENIFVGIAILSLAAILGNASGYAIGVKAGPTIFSRPDSRLFKQAYVDQTAAFFDKYGARAIVLARFTPIVRTFITVFAGVGRMDFRRYMTYSTIGGLLWVISMTTAGYLLGNIPFVSNNIEFIAIGIVFVSVIPIGIEYFRARRGERNADYDEVAERERVIRDKMHGGEDAIDA